MWNLHGEGAATDVGRIEMSWAGVEVWKTPRCLPSPSSEPSNMVLYAPAPPSPCREEYRIYSSQELNKTPARTLPVGDIGWFCSACTQTLDPITRPSFSWRNHSVLVLGRPVWLVQPSSRDRQSPGLASRSLASHWSQVIVQGWALDPT